MSIRSKEASLISHASTVAEIKSALKELGEREAAVTSRLDALLATQKDLARHLARLDIARAHLRSQAVATRTLSQGTLSVAADTARRISASVTSLDREQHNVRSTLAVVDQVAELKACVLGVHGSMGAPQDWEAAANYLHRARQIPDEIIDGAFAEEMVPTSEVPDTPRQTLESAAESLCGLFVREFEKAVKSGDGSNVARFFKLFPLIDRSAIGLDAYGRYVCAGISSRARANMAASNRKDGAFYANALTKLFEHIAEIVQGHEALVERHYGAGSMTKVIERIQVEADVQGGIILDTWSEEKNVARKLTDIKAYPFNFLAQGLLNPAISGSRSGRGSPAPGRVSEDNSSIDPKEIDALLNQSAMMLSRWSLYTRFLATKCRGESEAESEDSVLTVPTFISQSSLQNKVTTHLINPHTAMAVFLFRHSVEKAFQLDEMPSDLTLNPSKPIASPPPYITSSVDDSMYNAQQSIQRTLATAQRAVVASVIPSIGRVLSTDFYGLIQRKMKDEAFPRGATQNSLPPEHVVAKFCVLLNNLDVSGDYIRRIVVNTASASASDEPNLADRFPFAHDAVFVDNALHAIETSFVTKATELIEDAVEVLIKRVVRLRLRAVLADAFRDADYALTHNDDDEDRDALHVVHRFERGWAAFMSPLKRLLTPSNYARVLGDTVTLTAKYLQERVFSLQGRITDLGALTLERDLAGVIDVIVREGSYELREGFRKLTQMLNILVMEADEWAALNLVKTEEEVEELTGVKWRLDREERVRVRDVLGG